MMEFLEREGGKADRTVGPQASATRMCGVCHTDGSPKCKANVIMAAPKRCAGDVSFEMGPHLCKRRYGMKKTDNALRHCRFWSIC